MYDRDSLLAKAPPTATLETLAPIPSAVVPRLMLLSVDNIPAVIICLALCKSPMLIF